MGKKNNTDDIHELGAEQRAVFEALENTSQNLFITGKAGTGKSLLLEYFVRYTQKQVAVVAPTGVAALNVGGQTIHSFFRLAPHLHQAGARMSVDAKTKKLLSALDVLIIDEVSMMSADLLEAISQKLQLAREDYSPFGGVQVALFGDPYQLPPVVVDPVAKQYLDHTFGGSYFFYSHAYQGANVRLWELEEVFRQKDDYFKRVLSDIRSGEINHGTIEALNKRASVPAPAECITLASTNKVVEHINRSEIAKLTGQEKTYKAVITGSLQENTFPTEENLRLRVGSQVMILKNDKQNPRRWGNGTLAVVTKLLDDSIVVKVNGVAYTLAPAVWEKIQYQYDTKKQKLKKKVVSSFTQIPVRLAWAITIHKSQGQTYDRVVVDLSDGAFAYGQTYVALSRCTSLEGLYLKKPIRKEDILVDAEVKNFMNNKQNTEEYYEEVYE